MNRLVGTMLVLVMAGYGCAATQGARSAEKSGVLGDYSMLKEGKRGVLMEGTEDQALWIYKNPDADWRKYKKIQLDPVTVWVGKDSQISKVSAEDRKRLADVLWSKLHESLKQDYEITTEPGPDVIRLQAALTEAEESWVVLDTISSVIPQTRMLSGLKSEATGVSLFTGSTSVEFKATDATTGTVLAAAVDRRGGTKSLRGAFSSWHDVEEACRFWAEKVRYRACQWRGASNCIEPKA